MARLTGIFAALPTPLDSKRELDESGLEHLVEYLSGRERLAGFALCTEAAEDDFLSLEERKTLVRLVSQMRKDQHALLVRLSSRRSKDAAELAKVAESVGAAAVSLKLPRLPGVGYRELYRHVDHVCRAVKIPVFIHTAPGDGLESLQPEEFETLIGYEGLSGVVAPHAVDEELKRWKKFFPEQNQSILAGSSLSRSDCQTATGVVCGSYVLIPEAGDSLDEAQTRGEKGLIKKLETKWFGARALMGPKRGEAAPAGIQKLTAKLAKRSLEQLQLPVTYSAPRIKAALMLQGHSIGAEVRAPLETLRKASLKKLETQLRKVGILA